MGTHRGIAGITPHLRNPTHAHPHLPRPLDRRSRLLRHHLRIRPAPCSIRVLGSSRLGHRDCGLFPCLTPAPVPRLTQPRPVRGFYCPDDSRSHYVRLSHARFLLSPPIPYLTPSRALTPRSTPLGFPLPSLDPPPPPSNPPSPPLPSAPSPSGAPPVPLSLLISLLSLPISPLRNILAVKKMRELDTDRMGEIGGESSVTMSRRMISPTPQDDASHTP